MERQGGQGDKGEIFGIQASKNPVYLITIPLKKLFMQEVYCWDGGGLMKCNVPYQMAIAIIINTSIINKIFVSIDQI